MQKLIINYNKSINRRVLDKKYNFDIKDYLFDCKKKFNIVIRLLYSTNVYQSNVFQKPLPHIIRSYRNFKIF